MLIREITLCILFPPTNVGEGEREIDELSVLSIATQDQIGVGEVSRRCVL